MIWFLVGFLFGFAWLVKKKENELQSQINLINNKCPPHKWDFKDNSVVCIKCNYNIKETLKRESNNG